MTDISNSPHLWLVPFWAALKRQPFFNHLAPELRAGALAAALEADYPAKAQEIREWNFATRRAMLAVLDEHLKTGAPARRIELWRMRKGEREVRCVAVYTSVGVDLRLLAPDGMVQTALCRDPMLVRNRAESWQRQLMAFGWSTMQAE
ncbi:MAG: hypothetical protein QM736_16545 [Vicinamibacterales bacterium]